ncbi:MAG TPA: hypothetical protein DDY16_06730 [Tenacibaculum sp.]|nr:hypothetical protein [Tenacibaculum sp.]HBI40627.1 hypothetical protein [Tenacibaculum sp.]
MLPKGRKFFKVFLENMNRNKLVKFRVTGLEKLAIENRAKNTGLSTSEFCRNTALGTTVKSKFTAEEFEVYNTLTIYHKNFTALSNLFKRKDPSLSNEVSLLAKQIKSHLDKIK